MKIYTFTSTIADGNMSYKFGSKEDVDANHRRFFAKHGIRPGRVVTMEQVHSDRIGVVKRSQYRNKTDGLITKTPDLWLVVYHADCLPLFLIDEKTPAVGAVHIGWKGAVNGIAGKIVREMVKHFKTDPKNLKVEFGPFICSKHYDVDINDERIKHLPHTIKNGRAYVDILKPVLDQLSQTGILTSNILTPNTQCTAEHTDKYWSHHILRDKREGGMISVIGL